MSSQPPPSPTLRLLCFEALLVGWGVPTPVFTLSQLLSPASPFFHHLGSLSSNENQLILNLPLCLLLNNSGWKSLQPLSLSPSTALSSLSQLISQNNSNEWVHPFPLFPSHPLQTLIPEERASEESLAMRPGQP